MKKHKHRDRFYGIFPLLPLLIILLLPPSLRTEKSEVPPVAEFTAREDITFILGNDRNDANPFYRKAEIYFRTNENERTEYVVTSCTSLSEVQDYLVRHASGNRPWGKINLVSHGNRYQGLSVKVEPDGKRADPEWIRESLDKGRLGKLPAGVIDEQTSLVLHACGLGTQAAISEVLQEAFSSEGKAPLVKSSEHFEYFIADENNETKVERFYAESWFIRYKMRYRPPDETIIRIFQNKYPDQPVDWETALKNEKAEQAGDVFHYSFDVPVKWVISYESKDSVPFLKTQQACHNWVRKNAEIMRDLEKLEIPPEKFNWWMRRVYVKNEDGSLSPALWIKGYCTMLCVLRLLPEEEI